MAEWYGVIIAFYIYGKIIRIILQQAEKAGLVEKGKKGKTVGRQLTKQGKEFLESLV